jgi:hypothetical protein
MSAWATLANALTTASQNITKHNLQAPFLALNESSRENWNFEDVQVAAGGFIVHDDELSVYASGRRIPTLPKPPPHGAPQVDSTGRANIRRDGFASIGAASAASTNVSVTTRPITFSRPRRHLFVNWDNGTAVSGTVGAAGGPTTPAAAGGFNALPVTARASRRTASSPAGSESPSRARAPVLTVSILDANGTVIPPFSAENCIPIQAGGTRIPVAWVGDADSSKLALLAGQVVRLRFEFSSAQQPTSASNGEPELVATTNDARLYSFWFSQTECGESLGYAAAGGPATGIRDGKDLGGSGGCKSATSRAGANP